jgi:hypothetical protein
VRVCVHRGECMRVYVSVYVCTVFLKKKYNTCILNSIYFKWVDFMFVSGPLNMHPNGLTMPNAMYDSHPWHRLKLMRHENILKLGSRKNNFLF